MSSSPEPRTLVVIPAYNEEATITMVVRQCLDNGLQTLVIDDGSRDRTAELASNAGAVVLRLPFNLGVGGALRCGFRWSVRHGYSAVVQCDADGQHSPAQIRRLIDDAETRNLDLVIGSRFAGDSEFISSRLRRIPMTVMARLASRFAGTRLTDVTSGFRIIREPLLSQVSERFPTHYLGDTFDATVEAARGGFKIGEISVSMKERQGGVPSSNTLWSIVYLVRSFSVLVLGRSLRYSRPKVEIG